MRETCEGAKRRRETHTFFLPHISLLNMHVNNPFVVLEPLWSYIDFSLFAFFSWSKTSFWDGIFLEAGRFFLRLLQHVSMRGNVNMTFWMDPSYEKEKKVQHRSPFNFNKTFKAFKSMRLDSFTFQTNRWCLAITKLPFHCYKYSFLVWKMMTLCSNECIRTFNLWLMTHSLCFLGGKNK